MHPTIQSLRNSPIFVPLAQALSRFSDYQELPTPNELNATLCLREISFVPQTAKSPHFEEGYEQRIFLKGEVQTREQSWHDFFNALAWCTFPRSKKIINALQYRLQKERQPSTQRLPAENMLTLFDENGAIVLAKDPELLRLVKQHMWHELFWQRRQNLHDSLKVVIFGHGLYEKALRPYVGLTAQCLLLNECDPSDADAVVSDLLKGKHLSLSTADLHPLPILGIPGWSPQNTREDFYSNTQYFRPLRRLDKK